LEGQKQPDEQELHPDEWFQKDPEPAVPVKKVGFAWRQFGRYQALAAVVAVVLLGGGLVFAKVASHNKKPALKSPQQQQIASDQTDSETPVIAPVIKGSTTSKKDTSKVTSSPASTTSTSSDPVAPGKVSPGSSAGANTSTSRTYRVSYTNACFSPASLTIKKGDTVKFTNDSTRNFWPASDDHPSHSIYPEFDAKQAIAPGSFYAFTFSKVGTWGYHDHLKPGCKGTITVQ
jgi:plastocyanin